MKNQWIRLSALSILLLAGSAAEAAGYKLEMQSSAVLADSGEAAVIDDASTNWYNSAGLVYLPQQLVGSVIDVHSETSFSGTAFTPSPFGPGFDYLATGTASSHPNAILPAIHYVYPFLSRYAFGISIVPAWGLLEDFGNSSLVRYDLISVHTKTIDISPSLAMKINDQWSVGAGPDFNYFSVQTKLAALTEGPALFGGTLSDSLSRYSAQGWGRGWHVGVLFKPTESTRIGLNYRSKITMDLRGYSDFVLSGVASFESNEFTLGLVHPATTTFSVYQDINPTWAVMGTIAYDQWSLLNTYHARNYVQPTGVVNVNLPEHMHNTLDYSIGAHYKLNQQWMLRANMKYIATPTINSFRDINFPDSAKLGFQLGGHYQMTQALGFDMFYGHVFTRKAWVTPVNPVSFATINGNIRTHLDIVGAQVVWNI